jgi:uncharacterized protein (TIGR02444 family)
MNANANNFWLYSVAFYREPGIAEACLKLQNQHGFDVNLVLFCLWYGLNRGLVPAPLLQQAVDFSHYWNALGVQPLRDARTMLKSDTRLRSLSSAADINALRESIKGLELKAEQIQQQELKQLAAAHRTTMRKATPQVDMMQENLKNLCELSGCEWQRAEPQLQLILESVGKALAE